MEGLVRRRLQVSNSVELDKVKDGGIQTMIQKHDTKRPGKLSKSSADVRNKHRLIKNCNKFQKDMTI